MKQRMEFERNFRAAESLARWRYRLERRLGALMSILGDTSQGLLLARFTLVGAAWQVELQPIGFQGGERVCSIRASIDWSRLGKSHDDYFRKSAAAWFEYWTSELTPLAAAESFEVDGPLAAGDWHELLVDEQSQKTHADILRRLEVEVRGGARLIFSDKEGATQLEFVGGRYRRISSGDHPPGEVYDTAADCFLDAKRLLRSRLVGRAGGDDTDELMVWKMMLRWLQP